MSDLFVAKPLLSALYSTLGFLLGYILLKVKNELWKPSRTYDKDANSVGREYDAWTSEGILEYYWGEHIHLGYYSPEEMAKGYKKKNFIKAKYDFIDEMVKFGKLQLNNGKSLKILDVGCGIGGTSRYLASNIPGSTVTGITLSSKQVERATQLAKDRNIPNANFQVMDALNMTYPDNSFDVVWACESGEHMPDKKRYVEEMTRVLKPGGRIVIATWCQRDDEVKPFVEEVTYSTTTTSITYNILYQIYCCKHNFYYFIILLFCYIYRSVKCLTFYTPSGPIHISCPSLTTPSLCGVRVCSPKCRPMTGPLPLSPVGSTPFGWVCSIPGQ